MTLPYRNRSSIAASNPQLAQALDDLADHIEVTMRTTNVGPQGVTAPPPDISAFQVTASQGIFEMAIIDNTSQVNRGINYFVEYSLSPSFVSPVVLDLGASRNFRTFFGNQTLYFRAYSAYPTSARSKPVYVGTLLNPTAIVGGGASTGPAPLPSSGSGTSSGSSGGDGGFGNDSSRGTGGFLR